MANTIYCKECKNEVIVSDLSLWCPACRCYVDETGDRLLSVPLAVAREVHAFCDVLIKMNRAETDFARALFGNDMLKKIITLRDQLADILEKAEGK